MADTQNSVIRKITPLGTVSVLAGTPAFLASADGRAPPRFFPARRESPWTAPATFMSPTPATAPFRKITSGGMVDHFGRVCRQPRQRGRHGNKRAVLRAGGRAVDNTGNVYVADTWNHTVRKITSGGVSSTLAGLAGTPGTFDGTNTGARFNFPTGVALDSANNIYVTDYNNDTIRKVTPAGAVTTLAGWAGIWGNTDGTNGNALFSGPAGISVDNSGNVYVADSGNQTLRKVTPSGTNWAVSTVAGLAGVSGSTDGTGSGAEFYYPAGVAVSGAGYVYVADSGNNTVRSQGIPPTISVQPQSQTNLAGAIATFTVVANGSSPLTYVWQYNGTNFPTGNSSLMATNAGTYFVTVSNVAGSIISSNATLTLTNLPPQPGTFQGIVVQANGTIRIGLGGTSGATYTLDVSTNLATWSALATFSMTNGAVQFFDSTASNSPMRFYKLVSP